MTFVDILTLCSTLKLAPTISDTLSRIARTMNQGDENNQVLRKANGEAPQAVEDEDLKLQRRSAMMPALFSTHIYGRGVQK